MSSIKVLKNFLAITRHKSVASAAKEIGLTAAAAGQQLQQLESELGVELFDRTKRSLSLNHQGRSLIEPIQDIVARYEALGSDFKSELSGSSTLLRQRLKELFKTRRRRQSELRQRKLLKRRELNLQGLKQRLTR